MSDENSKKIILDLCGGTGAWSEPYADAGYDVRVITLPYLPLFEAVNGLNRKAIRATTPAGFAKAFFEANK